MKFTNYFIKVDNIMWKYFCFVFVFCVQFASAMDVRFERNGVDHPFNDGEIIAVKLMSYQINRVSRPDLVGKNEGEVFIEFGTKKVQTRLFWSGKTREHLDFQYGDGILLYFGRIADLVPPAPAPAPVPVPAPVPAAPAPAVAPLAVLPDPPANMLNYSLPFHVSVTEDDEGDDLKWQKAAENIKKIGESAAAFAPPPYGAAASAGVGFLGGVVSFFSTVVHRSTTELNYEGDFLHPHFHNPVPNPVNIRGDYTLSVWQQHHNDPDIILNFRLDGFPIFQNPFPALSNVRVMLESLLIPPGIAGKIAKGNLLTVAKGLATFEMKLNTKSSIKHSVYPEAFRAGVFKLESALIYMGPWIDTGMSVSVSLVYTKEERKLEDLASSLAALTNAVVALPGVNPPGPVVPVLNTLQTVSSIALASAKPESEHSLFSLGIELISSPDQTITFPMYSPKSQRNLGDIQAHIRVLPG